MRFGFFILLLFLNSVILGQSRSTDEWIDFGGDHFNKWQQFAPAKMGPNALPVPEMDYGLIDSMSGLEMGVQSHFMEGDNAFNLYMSIDWCVVPEKVMMKVWGIPQEIFKMSNSVRDERQVYYDDTGWINQTGDLWIGTFIQIAKEKNKLPDLVLNYTMKTTTGESDHGRYTDASVHYFYLAMGKSWFPGNGFLDEVRLGGIAGFYVWQTNKVEVAQDEGPLIELGLDFKHKELSLRNEIGGYSGYGAYKYIGITGDNSPLIYRFRITKTGKRFLWKMEYQTGIHDYHYQTFKMGFTYRFDIQ